MTQSAAKNKDELTLNVDTRFMGTRLNPQFKGSISNIDPSNLQTGNLCAGFLEGMVEELWNFYRLFSSDVRVKELVGSGNALRRIQPLEEIISERFRMKVRIPFYSEEAAYGAALNAAVELGFIRSHQEAGNLIRYRV